FDKTISCGDFSNHGLCCIVKHIADIGFPAMAQPNDRQAVGSMAFWNRTITAVCMSVYIIFSVRNWNLSSFGALWTEDYSFSKKSNRHAWLPASIEKVARGFSICNHRIAYCIYNGHFPTAKFYDYKKSWL